MCQHPRIFCSEASSWHNWLALVSISPCLLLDSQSHGLLWPWLGLCFVLSCHADDKSIFVGSQAILWLSYLVFFFLFFACYLCCLLSFQMEHQWSLATSTPSCHLYIYEVLLSCGSDLYLCSHIPRFPGIVTTGKALTSTLLEEFSWLNSSDGVLTTCWLLNHLTPQTQSNGLFQRSHFWVL